MSHLNSNRRKPAASAAAAVLVLLLACLSLAACGSSSGSSSSTTSASASTTTTGATGATGAKGPSSGRFAAMRECLQKNGVTLPAFKPGQHGQPQARGPFGAGSAAKLPKGVTRAQYEAALKKCGGGNFAGRDRGGARFKSPAVQAALAKFATCLRENGVNVPAPNTSGKGPVFDTKGIDTSSAKFKAAEAKCQSDLTAAFRHGAGARGSGSGSGAAPGGTTAPGGAAASGGGGEAPGGASGEAPGGASGEAPAG
jgi:hypothetical protein